MLLFCLFVRKCLLSRVGLEIKWDSTGIYVANYVGKVRIPAFLLGTFPNYGKTI